MPGAAWQADCSVATSGRPADYPLLVAVLRRSAAAARRPSEPPHSVESIAHRCAPWDVFQCSERRPTDCPILGKKKPADALKDARTPLFRTGATSRGRRLEPAPWTERVFYLSSL